MAETRHTDRTVRPFRRADLKATAATMARAFADDPLMMWIFPTHPIRLRPHVHGAPARAAPEAALLRGRDGSRPAGSGHWRGRRADAVATGSLRCRGAACVPGVQQREQRSLLPAAWLHGDQGTHDLLRRPAAMADVARSAMKVIAAAGAYSEPPAGEQATWLEHLLVAVLSVCTYSIPA